MPPINVTQIHYTETHSFEFKAGEQNLFDGNFAQLSAVQEYQTFVVTRVDNDPGVNFTESAFLGPFEESGDIRKVIDVSKRDEPAPKTIINIGNYFYYRSRASAALDPRSVREWVWQMVYEAAIAQDINKIIDPKEWIERCLQAAYAFIYAQWENYVRDLKDEEWSKLNTAYAGRVNKLRSGKAPYLTCVPADLHLAPFGLATTGYCYQLITTKEKFEENLKKELFTAESLVLMHYFSDKKRALSQNTTKEQLNAAVEYFKPLSDPTTGEKIFNHLHKKYEAAKTYTWWIMPVIRFFSSIFQALPSRNTINLFKNVYRKACEAKERTISNDIIKTSVAEAQEDVPTAYGTKAFTDAYLSEVKSGDDQLSQFKNQIKNLLKQNKLNIYVLYRILEGNPLFKRPDKNNPEAVRTYNEAMEYFKNIFNHLSQSDPKLSSLAAHCYDYHKKGFIEFNKKGNYFKEKLGVTLEAEAWRELIKTSGEKEKEIKEIFKEYLISKLGERQTSNTMYRQKIKHTFNCDNDEQLETDFLKYFWEKIQDPSTKTLNITNELENFSGPNGKINYQDIDKETGTLLTKKEIEEVFKYFKENGHGKMKLYRGGEFIYTIELPEDRKSLIVTYAHRHRKNNFQLYSIKNRNKAGSLVGEGAFKEVSYTHHIPVKNINTDDPNDWLEKDRLKYEWKATAKQRKTTGLVDKQVAARDFNSQIIENTIKIESHPNPNKPYRLRQRLPLVLGDTLESFINDPSKLRILKPYFPQLIVLLLKKLKKMHEKSIEHVDIKPGNILVHIDNNNELHVDFIDYDLSKYYKDIAESSKRLLGTFNYMPPWKISENSNRGSELSDDLWSLGKTIKYLLNNDLYIKENEYHLINNALLGSFRVDINFAIIATDDGPRIIKDDQYIFYNPALLYEPPINSSCRERKIHTLANKIMGYNQNEAIPNPYGITDLNKFIAEAEVIYHENREDNKNNPQSPKAPYRLVC